MAEILFPMTTTPGEHRQHGRGRLINMFAEPIVTDDRPAQANKTVWRRVAGTTLWGTTAAALPAPYRNMIYAGGRLHVAHGDTVRNFGVNGSGMATVTGTLPGSPVKAIWAKNNKTTPDIITVVPGEGAFQVTNTTVTSYAPVALPVPNSVCFLSGFFIFSIADGRMFSTDVNALTVNSLNYAMAETRPDTLLRVVPVGNGQLLACGDSSMEVWGPPINPSAFPFSYVSAMPYGLIGRNAIAGTEDGWTKGIFFVAADYGVYSLNNFQPLKVSPPDLDRLIKQTMIKDEIEVGVFGHSGRGIVSVQTSRWCWHFDTNTLKWHERESHLQNYWRHLKPEYAWNAWIAGDRKTTDLFVIDSDIESEAGDPLTAQMIGLVDVFPAKTRIARIDLDVTHGVGITTGTVPIQTDPVMHIAYSVDGGVNYSDPTLRRFGQMGQPVGVATVRNCGIVRAKQFKVKVTVSDPVFFAVMGGNVEAA
jgi:hypothetical protein